MPLKKDIYFKVSAGKIIDKLSFQCSFFLQKQLYFLQFNW